MPGSTDFRDHLIVDQNNLVLFQKGWRDDDQRGWAYLGVTHGEDALSWNVFHSLDLDPARGAVNQGFLDLGSPVEEVLFWGCNPDGEAEAQQTIGILLRDNDGNQGGTPTEPDLLILNAPGVCFVECKVPPSHFPWAAKGQPPAARKASSRNPPAAGTIRLQKVSDSLPWRHEESGIAAGPRSGPLWRE